MNKFEDWNQVLPKLPVTEILISDPYLFETKGDDDMLEENYFKLLKSIKNTYGHSLNNLLIFSTIQNITKVNAIREKSNKILGVKVGVVLFQKESEHDRHIFTNYNHIKIGSSLNFLFDISGNLVVKKKSTINVFSYCNIKNTEEASIVLEFLKQHVSQLKKSKKIPYFLNSNLFDF